MSLKSVLCARRTAGIDEVGEIRGKCGLIAVGNVPVFSVYEFLDVVIIFGFFCSGSLVSGIFLRDYILINMKSNDLNSLYEYI